jgi:hypothetical protein
MNQKVKPGKREIPKKSGRFRKKWKISNKMEITNQKGFAGVWKYNLKSV